MFPADVDSIAAAHSAVAVVYLDLFVAAYDQICDVVDVVVVVVVVDVVVVVAVVVVVVVADFVCDASPVVDVVVAVAAKVVSSEEHIFLI